MKALFCATLAVVVALSGSSWAQSTERKNASPGSARETLVGAWHLLWLDEPGADGKLKRITDAKGSLIYTPDGHMSVQVMYAKPESASSNNPVAYAQGGYEGSFGRYDVNEAAHTVTHHVEGANVRALVGKDLPRMYQFSDGHLIIRSSRTDEHWSVTWEHY
ncbi:MAG: lipocalin-like domain-containing protein [Nostoc sp.]|uniref:lipocalin-like domain-containing protein n=1 Tax=Nostoc sp. TaxID=1180 RepID=UPI002FF79562